MIHHHPTIVKANISEALDIVAQIKSYDPNYTSAELAIAYDFTLNDFHNASNAKETEDSSFWLFHPIAIKFLQTSLELKSTIEAANSIQNQNVSFIEIYDKSGNYNYNLGQSYIHNTTTCHYNINGHEIPFATSLPQFNKTETFCEHLLFSTKLRNPHQFESDILDFVTDYSKIVDLTNMFYLPSIYGITILTTISNVIAGSYPELALDILEKEAFFVQNFPHVTYAVEDFRAEPAQELLGQKYNASDYISDLCIEAGL